ncbi:ribosome maturation factor RimM [Qipengyuania sp. ASV99]|uniref:ribosome maturation factor RimM n=1 Tax=Qipengyuania sp. ASV99 TaxID=3399681 RepID=UPI003A4C5765
MVSTKEPITIAAITGAHGVAGEVRLKLLGEGLDALRQHRAFNDGTLTLRKIRSDNKGGAIASFAEVQGRAAAEKLRGTAITVARDELPPLAEGEYYHRDLIGLAVVTDTGAAIGRIIAVENFGASDVLEIERDPAPDKGMKTFMVPMTAAAVIEWDETRLVISQDFADE